jgi:S-adenosylmethionine:tRNA ribosyltransferase-isomerase
VTEEGKTPLAAFDYDLPEEAIAQVPIEPRSAARLLVALDPDGAVEHRRVTDLPDLIGNGDVLVVNDTRVRRARLLLRKATGGQVEVLLLAPLADGSGSWEALVRPARRLRPGTLLYAPAEPGREPEVGADAETAETKAGAVVEVLGRAPDEAASAAGDDNQGAAIHLVRLLDPAAAEEHGKVPLPPYITHELHDPERYQTVYARNPSSSAAPTAGLHFTPQLLADCRERGAQIAHIELAVGLGTFKPMTSTYVEDHNIHREEYSVPAETLAACRSARRVIAVGTTVLRALETVAAGGPLEGSTELFVHGSYRFGLVDVLMTNFHLPRSSLLVLVEAFAGPRWRQLYELALADGYRFLSFGDAMIVSRR